MTEENFSSPSIRTCSKAHPATYSMHIFGNLPGIKATWNNYFRSSFVVQRLRMCGVTSSASNHGVVFNKWDGKNLPFFTFQTYQINRCLSLKRVLLSKKQFKYFFAYFETTIVQETISANHWIFVEKSCIEQRGARVRIIVSRTRGHARHVSESCN